VPQPTVRVVGGGFTTFNYKGKPLAFLEALTDTGQKPYQGNAYQPIYALGDLRAREIVTQPVLGVGSLTLRLRELWNEPVWWQLADLSGTDTITDVWDKLRQEPSFVTCTKIITPPTGVGPARIINYRNCVITNIDDTENIQVGDLSVAKNIDLIYTHKERG